MQTRSNDRSQLCRQLRLPLPANRQGCQTTQTTSSWGALGKVAYHAGLYGVARLIGGNDRWFERRIHAIERITLILEILRLISRGPAYLHWARERTD